MDAHSRLGQPAAVKPPPDAAASAAALDLAPQCLAIHEVPR